MADKSRSAVGADAATETGFLAAVQRMSATRWNYFVGQTCDFLVSFALLAAAAAVDRDHPLRATVAIVVGLFVFSFIEYAFHRWLFHGSIALFERGHTLHHQRPLGYDSLPFFFSPVVVLLLAALLAALMPVGAALYLAGAIALGYALYGYAHFIVHRYRFHNAAWRAWVRIHNIHHAHPDKNYGVTTPLWDFVLGTWYVSKSKVPHR